MQKIRHVLKKCLLHFLKSICDLLKNVHHTYANYTLGIWKMFITYLKKYP